MLATRIIRAAAASASSALTQSAGPTAASGLIRGRTSTNLTGLAIHPDPLPLLKDTYGRTLKALGHLPASSIYRQATEALTKARLDKVDKAWYEVARLSAGAREEDTSERYERVLIALEDALDVGVVEEVILQAKDEEQLVGKLSEWKSWDALEHPPPPGQWDYFAENSEIDP